MEHASSTIIMRLRHTTLLVLAVLANATAHGQGTPGSSIVSRTYLSGDVAYTYDLHGWTTGITTNRFSEGVQYDAHGNVTGIVRRGKTSAYTYGLMDNLTLAYDGDRLTGVTETAADYDFSGSFEYKGANGSLYIYNANGSLVADRSRGIAYIAYDDYNKKN